MKAKIAIMTAIILCIGMHIAAEGAIEAAPGLRREVHLIIPEEHGSTPDQLIRVVVPAVEEGLPFPVMVENGQGFSPSRADGYSWIGGNINKYADSPSPDMHAFIVFEVPLVLAASPESPLASFPDIFLADRGPSPLDCPVSPVAMRREKIDSRRVRHIRFRETELVGALKETINGRVPMMAALSVELTEMLRSGRLKGLAVLSSSALRIEGYGTIPSVSYWEREYSPKPDYFGILLPGTTPPEMQKMMTDIWTQTIHGSRELRKYAAERGLVFNPQVIPAETGTH